LIGRLQRGEDAHDAILRIARQREAGIVAMHSRGSGAVRHALLGSVAMGVLKKTDVPLFLIGGEAAAPRTEPGYHIVATSDGSPASTGVLRALAPLLAGTVARVSLLRVCELRSGRAGPEAEIERATAQLESLWPLLPPEVKGEVHCRVCPHQEDISTAIVAGARELGADAIALSTHGESALRHLLAGSVALSVLELSPLPVILSRGLEAH
jgi:nucleotide-binding universal stress UspA family protein